MQTYFVYKLTCSVNQKVYIGVSKDASNRLKQHRSDARKGINRMLYCAMRKHGIDTFSMEIIYGSRDKEHIFKEMEQFFIRLYESNTPAKGYNLTFGGEGGNTIISLTKEQRIIRGKKISDKLTGRIKSETHKHNISVSKKGKFEGNKNPMWGKTQSEEGKKRIGAASKQRMTGRKVSEETRKKLSKNATGVIFSEERKQKISKAKKGKPSPLKGRKFPSPSEATRLKMSLAHKGKNYNNKGRTGMPHSDITRAKMSLAQKGKPSPLKGRTFSEERRKKQSEAIRAWLKRHKS